MEVKGIKYIAPCLDGSGYGQASRGNILALNSLGVPITVSPISFEQARPNTGKYGEVLEALIQKNIDYNVVLIHSTPEFWEKYKEKDKKVCGYTLWETTRLHRDWSAHVNNNVDKILVGSTWNIKVFKDSGINIPIGVVPHGINMNEYDDVVDFTVAGVNESTFMFYDIFQWTERKHPIALIKAYWYAFQNDEKVALVLKTYRNDYSDTEKDAIRTTINRLKAVTPSPNGSYARIYLISNMLSRDEILGLHKRGDCYVSLDRGEGFGLGPFEAGAIGNPIIVTGFGGVTEFAKETNSYLVDYSLTPVFGMPYSPWYTFDQLWAEPDILNASKLMKHVYNNRNEAKKIGEQLQRDIIKKFSWEEIGKKIIKELEIM